MLGQFKAPHNDWKAGSCSVSSGLSSKLSEKNMKIGTPWNCHYCHLFSSWASGSNMWHMLNYWILDLIDRLVPSTSWRTDQGASWIKSHLNCKKLSFSRRVPLVTKICRHFNNFLLFIIRTVTAKIKKCSMFINSLPIKLLSHDSCTRTTCLLWYTLLCRRLRISPILLSNDLTFSEIHGGMGSLRWDWWLC